MQTNNSRPKIIFFGSSQFVIPIIKILKENFSLSLVITTEKSDGVVPVYCQKNKITFMSVSTLKDKNLKSSILNLKSSVGVVADFGLIIPEEILNVFPKGIINIHPSLLPKYRGPTPVQTAIFSGDKTTGVSIIKLDKEVDHGPILGMAQEDILDTDTAESLYKRLFAMGANLLLNILDKYLKRNLMLNAQNHEKATFTKLLTRQDGYINLNNIPIKEKLRLMIRAYYPWPGVWTKMKLNNKEKIIKFLPEKKIQVDGKKSMSYKDFINGYPEGKEVLKIVS